MASGSASIHCRERAAAYFSEASSRLRSSGFLAQAAHLWHAVEPHELAEFARCLAAQLLGGFDPAQAHEAQQNQDLIGRVIAADFSQEFAGRTQETVDQQGPECAEHSAIRHVTDVLEAHRNSVQCAERREHPLTGPRATRPHAIGRHRILHAALRLVGTCSGCAVILIFPIVISLQPPVPDRPAQCIHRHAQLCCHLRIDETFIEEFPGADQQLGGEHAPAALGGFAPKEAVYSVRPVQPQRTVHLALGYAESLAHLRWTTGPGVHQLRYCQSKSALIRSTVSVDGMHSEKISPLAAIVQNSHLGVDWRCTMRDDR